MLEVFFDEQSIVKQIKGLDRNQLCSAHEVSIVVVQAVNDVVDHIFVRNDSSSDA